MHSRNVNMSRLKQWAITNLFRDSTLRELLLQEPDTLSVEGFIAKCSTWMKLARIEKSSNRHQGGPYD
jgi:hypothetical protein